MKPLLSIAALMLLFTSFSYSQTISIAEFIQLRSQNTNAIESKLTSQNIQLYDQDEIGSGKTQYTYQNSDVSSKSSSFQWVDFVYAQDAQWNNRLSFQIQNIELVKKYLTEMKDLGFSYTGKKIVDRQIYDVFTNGLNIIELITSQNRKLDDNTMYFNFAFYSAGEYQYAFAKESSKFVPEINQDDLVASLVDFTNSTR